MKIAVVFAACAAVSLVSLPTAFAQKGNAPAAPAKSVAKKTTPIMCIITGEEIGSANKAAGKTVVNGKTYYFCCPGCVAKFNKADAATKAKYAKASDAWASDARVEKSVAPKKVSEPAKPVVEPAKPAAQAVPATPDKPAALHCAVTDEEIASVSDSGGSSVYNNKTYYFCCAGCKPQFDADPAKFAAIADAKNAERAKNKK